MRIQKNSNSKNSTLENLVKKLKGEGPSVEAEVKAEPPKQEQPEKPQKVADEDRAIPPRIGKAHRSGADQGSTGYGYANYDDMLKRLGKQP